MDENYININILGLHVNEINPSLGYFILFCHFICRLGEIHVCNQEQKAGEADG